ncbi:MAG: iron uptake system protein EfeO [Rhodobacteraceae bacterium]|nr:iron uptake system protein EfeO [Paracoccaceae bacterium]
MIAAAALLAAPAAQAEQVVQITVTQTGCEPAQVALTEGPVVFDIQNNSARALEWEILSGVMIVAERENILPGFHQSLKADLAAGDYAMTCGLLSNPQGAIRVADTNAAPAPMDPMALVGPVADYKAYVQAGTDELVSRTTEFVDAIHAQDLARAKALFAYAREPYERIEPVAELFADLDASMDSREDDWETGVKDPGFTGFHRIEYALFAENTTDGLQDLATRLLEDTKTLQARIRDLPVPARTVISGAGALIDEVAATKISGEEDRYSHTDLSDFQANMDGARKIISLLQAELTARDPAYLARIAAHFDAVDAILASYRDDTFQFKPYSDLTDADRRVLQGRITALAEDLGQLPGVLGLAI